MSGGDICGRAGGVVFVRKAGRVAQWHSVARGDTQQSGYSVHSCVCVLCITDSLVAFSTSHILYYPRPPTTAARVWNRSGCWETSSFKIQLDHRSVTQWRASSMTTIILFVSFRVIYSDNVPGPFTKLVNSWSQMIKLNLTKRSSAHSFLAMVLVRNLCLLLRKYSLQLVLLWSLKNFSLGRLSQRKAIYNIFCF